MIDFLEFLRSNPYPGRGIAVGNDRVYYFIMGRSENSRNRIFVATEDGIRTQAHDPAKMKDPSLIIYHPVRETEKGLIVTNGDQTDTIRDYGDFRKALMTREYEPDCPNFTPRISAMLYRDGSAELSILKEKDGRCLREFFCYEGFEEEKGVFLSTYQLIRAMITMKYTGSGKPRILNAPIAVKAGTVQLTILLFVKTIASPRKILWVANVTRNAGILNVVMTSP